MTQHTANSFSLPIDGKTYTVVYEAAPHPKGKNKPAVLFLHGLHSDRFGGKIEAGKQWCAENGVDFATLDYPCHGQSSGKFVDFTISHALLAARHIITKILKKPVVVVGSSTGGWVALILAKALPKQVKGVVTVANACDFTEQLYWNPLPEAEKKAWQEKGYKVEPSWDGGEWHTGFNLIQDGRKHLLFGGGLQHITCPVRLLHGTADKAVPWQTSIQVAEELGGDDVQVLLAPHADHRFSTPENLAMLAEAIASVVHRAGGLFSLP